MNRLRIRARRLATVMIALDGKATLASRRGEILVAHELLEARDQIRRQRSAVLRQMWQQQLAERVVPR